MIIGTEGAGSFTAPANSAYLVSQLTAQNMRPKIREVGLFTQAATIGTIIQLGRPAAAPSGSTPAGAITTVTEDPSDYAAAAFFIYAGTGWGTTNPTAPNPASRQWALQAGPGTSQIFFWPPDGELLLAITLGATGNFVVWNGGSSAGPALDAYIVAGA